MASRGERAILWQCAKTFLHPIARFAAHLIIKIPPMESICPRVAQRDAYLFKVSPQAHSMPSLFSGKRAEIPLPYENRRAMKDARKPNY
jgi:hypothetical protein